VIIASTRAMSTGSAEKAFITVGVPRFALALSLIDCACSAAYTCSARDMTVRHSASVFVKKPLRESMN